MSEEPERVIEVDPRLGRLPRGLLPTAGIFAAPWLGSVYSLFVDGGAHFKPLWLAIFAGWPLATHLLDSTYAKLDTLKVVTTQTAMVAGWLAVALGALGIALSGLIPLSDDVDAWMRRGIAALGFCAMSLEFVRLDRLRRALA